MIQDSLNQMGLTLSPFYLLTSWTKIIETPVSRITVQCIIYTNSPGLSGSLLDKTTFETFCALGSNKVHFLQRFKNIFHHSAFHVAFLHVFHD